MSARTYSQPASTIITMQLGVCLMVLLGLMFISGGLFYLYTFNYDVGPYFTLTRFIHFYAGLASIPFLLAKYGSTSFRFAGYYLRLPRFKKAGAPALLPRIFSPLLALDFFVLYFSGLYMLFHYYYTVTNIPPFEFKPVQVHLWASILAVPLIAVHLGSHLLEVAHGLYRERRELMEQPEPDAESARRVLTRRAFMGTVVAGGLGLALAFQNTPLLNKEFKGLFIGRIPDGEKGGPGDFPVETLFGKREVDVASWRLKIDGAVASELQLTYDELLALPAVTKDVRISCVSGWTSVPTWSGPRVRDVLDKAGANPRAKMVFFNSVSGYSLGWRRRRVVGGNAILATHVNGAPLSNNHGFPVRLIVPGYPGQNMVKQLNHIFVGKDGETNNPDFKLVSREGGDSACARRAGTEV